MNPRNHPSPFELRPTGESDCYVIEKLSSLVTTIQGDWATRMYHLLQGHYERIDCYKAMRHVMDGMPIPLTNSLSLLMHGKEMTWLNAQSEFKTPFLVQWGDSYRRISDSKEDVVHCHSAIIVHATFEQKNAIIFHVPGWNVHARLDTLLETHRRILKDNTNNRVYRFFSNENIQNQ